MAIPHVTDFTSATIVDAFDDMISPPGLTNHWAVVQVGHDVAAIRSLNIPPLSQGDCVTGRLYLQGRLAQSYGQPVEVTWRPDRVVRHTRIEGFDVTTTTVTPPGRQGVLVHLDVRNEGPDRELDLGLWIDSQATRSGAPWLAAAPPQEANDLRADGAMRLGTPRSTAAAVSLQALVGADGEPVHDVSLTDRLVSVTANLPAGGRWRGSYLHVLAGDETTARAEYDALRADVEAAIADSEAAWNAELAAVFTDEPTYPGRLPELSTSNEAL